MPAAVVQLPPEMRIESTESDHGCGFMPANCRNMSSTGHAAILLPILLLHLLWQLPLRGAPIGAWLLLLLLLLLLGPIGCGRPCGARC